MEWVGVDIGGTNIRVGGMERNEEVHRYVTEKTADNVSSGQELFDKILGMIHRLPGSENARAIGIGVPGSIDPKTEQVTIAENLRVLEGIPLASGLSNRLQKPVFLENDGRVAALAEAKLGGGTGRGIVCYITVSTGLGGGLVVDGEIYRGSGNMGAYISRMILDGKDTCDTLISGTGLMRQAKEQLGCELSNAGEVFTLPESEGKTLVLDSWKHNLTVMLMNVAALFNPDIILLGGGVMASREYFLDDVVRAFRCWAHPLFRNTEIAPAALPEPGVLGACLMAKSRFAKDQG